MDLLARKIDHAAEREFALCAAVIGRLAFRDVSLERQAMVHGIEIKELRERLVLFARFVNTAVRLGVNPIEIPNLPNAVDELFKAGPPKSD